MSQPITREREIVFLEQMIASETDKLMAIEDLDGKYLGNAGVHKIYWPARNGRLGVVLGNPSAHGKGLGTETIKLINAYGFLELGLHKIWVIHFVDNVRMRHIVGKLGFVQEGVLRDEYFHQDGFHDMIRHSLLEQEFASLQMSWGIEPRPS